MSYRATSRVYVDNEYQFSMTMESRNDRTSVDVTINNQYVGDYIPGEDIELYTRGYQRRRETTAFSDMRLPGEGLVRQVGRMIGL